MSEFDGPWKVAVELFLEWFMLLLFREAHAQIDWTRKPESLDKELQAITPQGETGRFVVDLLFKVWLKSGEEQWVLIHIEIQSQRVRNFGLRMYRYNYRIFDHQQQPVASFAVLADDDPSWRPDSFGYNLLGCKLAFEFPTVKLLDIPDQTLEQLQNTNPIATLVLAHRRTQQTHGNSKERMVWKLRLIRGLYEGGLKPDDARELLKLVYWMMDLPVELERQVWEQVKAIEQEKQMPHLLPFEVWALERGRDEGRKEGRKEGRDEGRDEGRKEGRTSALLEAIHDLASVRFGPEVAADFMARVGESADVEALKKLLVSVSTAGTDEELRQSLPGAGAA
jgi:hypothetical protein